MQPNHSFQRWSGIFAILAGILALLSLVIGLAGVNYDFEVFSDPSSLIAAGANVATYIQWSFWLNMFGNYLLLIPFALFLYQWLKSVNHAYAQLYTVSGLIYLLLGAAGAAILASSWPFLIETYAVSTAAMQEILVVEFQLVSTIAEGGLQGVIQNLAGAIWFLGIGAMLRTKQAGLGIFTMVIGVFLGLNMLGNMLHIEALSLLGLTANILLGPIWSIVLGIYLLRLKIE